MKTRIENVKILTMDGDNRVYEDGCVLVDGDRIEKVGDRKEAAGWSGGAEAAVLDGRGGILIPGLINTHCHVSMMPFRTLGDDCADRLRRFLFPLENDAMTRRLVYRAARYGICEMLLAGVTTFLDMYYFEDEVAKACEELGMRGFLGETVIGQATCEGPEPYTGLAYGEEFIRQWQGREVKVLLEEKVVIDGKEYMSGHTKEYIRAVVSGSGLRENTIISAKLSLRLNEDFVFCERID